jgi:hypothetical protein
VVPHATFSSTSMSSFSATHSSTSCTSTAVRKKTPFESHIDIQDKRSLYQDRLGTDIDMGIPEKKALHVRPARYGTRGPASQGGLAATCLLGGVRQKSPLDYSEGSGRYTARQNHSLYYDVCRSGDPDCSGVWCATTTCYIVICGLMALLISSL